MPTFIHMSGIAIRFTALALGAVIRIANEGDSTLELRMAVAL